MEKELLLFEARCSSLQANLTVALRQIGAYPKKICSSSCTEQSCSLSAEETERCSTTGTLPGGHVQTTAE